MVESAVMTETDPPINCPRPESVRIEVSLPGSVSQRLAKRDPGIVNRICIEIARKIAIQAGVTGIILDTPFDTRIWECDEGHVHIVLAAEGVLSDA